MEPGESLAGRRETVRDQTEEEAPGRSRSLQMAADLRAFARSHFTGLWHP